MTRNNLPTATPSPRGRRRVIYASDTCSIALNYLPDPVSEADLRSWVDDLADYEKRIDQKAGADKSSHKTAGLSPVPAVPDSFMTGWFRLTSPPAVFGDNRLGVTLTSGDPEASDDIVIKEIEVHVAP